MPPDSIQTLGRAPLTLDRATAIIRGASVNLEPGLATHLARSVTLLERLLSEGHSVYGVTTGFGGSVETQVLADQRAELALNLVRFHGCGTGRLFEPEETRAILVARLASLVRGHSAVRFEVVERLAALLNHGVLPAIPCEGSVGASGDLTPLSYVAAVLLGEREVWFRGRVSETAVALSELGLTPLVLQPKESLALMNGTSVMTGLSLIAFERATQLGRWAALLTAACCEAAHGQRAHFEQRLFELKPHPGQIRFAAWVRAALGPARSEEDAALQDRYSLRCSPHVVGVLLDQLRFSAPVLEVELNSVNDNPILDVESGRALHGGHFYGGHVCHVMDALKTCVANVADLFDRQLLLLCDGSTNRGLPQNLVAATPSAAHHGFKAMQITTSALTAEACKLCMPASVFSRSTENHNQDKVSLGTIGARDCQRILDLTERVLAIHTLAVAQALDLRGGPKGPGAVALHGAVREVAMPNVADRRMDKDIDAVLASHRRGAFSFEAQP